jgi:hypothetical protein
MSFGSYQRRATVRLHGAAGGIKKSFGGAFRRGAPELGNRPSFIGN